MIKDSGQHVEHSTGANRDSDTGRGAYELISPIFIERLAQHLEAGAQKYEPRNWERGLPIGRMFRSALCHTWQALAGYTDEDHLAAAACNLMFIMHTREMIRRRNLPADLDNVPDVSGSAIVNAGPDITRGLNDAVRDMIMRGEVAVTVPVGSVTAPVGSATTVSVGKPDRLDGKAHEHEDGAQCRGCVGHYSDPNMHAPYCPKAV